MGFKYAVDDVKYRVKPTGSYIRVNGWAFETTGAIIGFKTYLNGKKVPCSITKINRLDVNGKYSKYGNVEKKGFQVKVYIENDEMPSSFKLLIVNGKNVKVVVNLNKKKILKIYDDNLISYKIEESHIREKEIIIDGWATSVNGAENIRIQVKDPDKKEVPVKISKRSRPDLIEHGYINKCDKTCGFQVRILKKASLAYDLVISDDAGNKVELDVQDVLREQKSRNRIQFIKKAIKRTNAKTIKKLFLQIKKNGFKGLKKYIVTHVNAIGKPYEVWFEEHRPTIEELQKQKDTIFDRQPKISIVVPTYKTPVIFLREMIDSVREQSYQNWELCIADGSEGDHKVEGELNKYRQLDSRIKYQILENNMGIAGNTNKALELATGEYIGLFDHDDMLAPNALYEVVRALQEEDYDILYTDEDKIYGEEKEHTGPNFKPDFSMDLFRSNNYITHFFVVKASIVRKIGGFRSEYDGSQDYDLMFRCIENAEKIKHIPMILYHWRIHMNSVAGNPTSKMYAYEAGKRAIKDHLERMGVDAEVEHVGLWGMYHVKYAVHGEPLVSVIIPNKDHINDLDKCVTSLFEKSVYKKFEIIIVENNSEKKSTFDYYEKLQEKYDNVKVIVWDKEFNYSKINNFGVKHALGEYLLFLNNDTEMITPQAILEMLGHCMREEVGAVGAKLLYEDDTVQHAGIVLGFSDYALHVNAGIKRDDYGFMVHARINCNYSAVTAACMMTKKSLFEQVGGFDEQFAVACNDIDYCLKLREQKKSIIFNAFSEWYHYESKSRGYEDTDEKIKRYEGEVKNFRKKWRKVLDEGDPFYNKNFSIIQAPYTLE